MNLADLPPTQGLPMFDEPRSPLAGERRHDMPRRALPLVPLPLCAGDTARLLSTIDRHLALARRSGQHLALLMVSMVPPEAGGGGDSGGVADALALEFGHRLRARVRSTDTVLWQGGGDYAALLQPCRQVGAMAARQRLLKALGGTYRLGEQRPLVSARIGCACFPAAGDTPALLLSAALSAQAG